MILFIVAALSPVVILLLGRLPFETDMPSIAGRNPLGVLATRAEWLQALESLPENELYVMN